MPALLSIANAVMNDPPTADPMIDPSETYLVTPITGAAANAAANPDHGDRTMSAAQPEAIPLPPLKLVNNGQLCPAIVASPVSECDQFGVSNIYTVIATGIAAFPMSRANATIPQIGPHTRATLVAPVLPLPKFLISIPFTSFPISKPNEMDPTRYPRTMKVIPAITPITASIP